MPHALPEQNLTAQSWRSTSSRGFGWLRGAGPRASVKTLAGRGTPTCSCHPLPSLPLWPPLWVPSQNSGACPPLDPAAWAGRGWQFSPCFVGGGGPLEARHPVRVPAERWCFTSMSWTPSFGLLLPPA